MKNRSKKWITLLLAVAVLLTPGSAVAESVDAWQPDSGITRAAFVANVNQMLQLREWDVRTTGFTDVEETHPQYNDIRMASCAGYVSGDGAGRFFPDAAITREEAAAMVGRLLPAAGARSSALLAAFPDAGQVSAWAREEMAVLVNKGYLRGRTDGTLASGDRLTRAEAEMILKRVQAAETIVTEDLVLDSAGAGLRDGIFTGMIVIKGPAGTEETIFENCSVLGPVIRLVGTVSEQDVRRMMEEITAELASDVASVEEAVRAGVQAVKPKTTVFTDETGAIVASVPREKRKRPAVHVTGIALAPPVFITHVGATTDNAIVATVTPDNAANKTVSWLSGNPAVATVENGVLTLHAQGTATVSAVTADGGIAAEARVSVVQVAWARLYYSFREEVEKQRARYVEGVDLTIGANLVAAEERFLAADCPLQRMLGNLPPVPGKEEFLAYYFTPTVERIVAARAAFDAARRL